MCGRTTGDSSLASARIHEVLVGNGAGWGPPPLRARRLGKLDILVIQSGRPTARQAPEPFVPKGQAKAGRCLSLGMTRARVGTRLRRALGNTLNLPRDLKPFATDRKLRPVVPPSARSLLIVLSRPWRQLAAVTQLFFAWLPTFPQAPGTRSLRRSRVAGRSRCHRGPGCSAPTPGMPWRSAATRSRADVL